MGIVVFKGAKAVQDDALVAFDSSLEAKCRELESDLAKLKALRAHVDAMAASKSTLASELDALQRKRTEFRAAFESEQELLVEQFNRQSAENASAHSAAQATASERQFLERQCRELVARRDELAAMVGELAQNYEEHKARLVAASEAEAHNIIAGANRLMDEVRGAAMTLEAAAEQEALATITAARVEAARFLSTASSEAATLKGVAEQEIFEWKDEQRRRHAAQRRHIVGEVLSALEASVTDEIREAKKGEGRSDALASLPQRLRRTVEALLEQSGLFHSRALPPTGGRLLKVVR